MQQQSKDAGQKNDKAFVTCNFDLEAAFDCILL
jgi:hypothetical protein